MKRFALCVATALIWMSSSTAFSAPAQECDKLADRCPSCCTNNCKDCSACKPNKS